MALPSNFAQQVKSSADIVRVIGEHVRLKKAGGNYVGLCPFHQEKTPSFSVHPARQFYYCFGCGAKGDVFRFVMETEKLSFPEAVRRIAQSAGIPIPAESSRETAGPEARLRAALEEIHRKTQEFYRQQLRSSEAAPLREVLRRRGVTEPSVEEFGLGFAPAGGRVLAQFLAREGFPAEALEASGLLIRRENDGFLDRFRNRWMFPIAAESGKITAFAGRAMGEEQPKYLNSPETALYSKSRLLYNLFRARTAIRAADSAVLVEGYMDVIAVHQAGVQNVIASCGTALTEPQVRMLARYGAEVVVSYDPDSAGVAATDRSLSLLLEEGRKVRVLRLPGGLDPDQFIQQKGAQAYRGQLVAAEPFFRYLAGRALELHGTATPEAKLAGINFVLPFVAKVPDKLIRAELIADLAQKMDVSAGIVGESFRKAGLERRDSLAPTREMSRIPSWEAMLIRLLLDSEQARQELGPMLEAKGLLPELEAGTIITTLLGVISAGSVPDMASLADRLDERNQRLFAQIIFDKDARPVSLSEVSSYIDVLERGRLEKQRHSLKQRISEAQKAQDHQMAVELLRQQRELDKALGRLV